MNDLQTIRLLAAILRGDVGRNGLAVALQQEGAPQKLADRASRQLVSPALYPALRRAGLLAGLPSEFAAYLEALHRLNAQRNAELLAQADEVQGELRACGIEPVALKGLALLVGGDHRDDGVRLMSDLDLLIPAGLVDRARSRLLEAGYRRVFAAGRDEAYYAASQQDAPLLHEEKRAAVELHRRLLKSERGEGLVARLGGAASLTVERDGRRWQVLTPTLHFAHVFLHAMVQDAARVRGTVPLRALFDARALWTAHPGLVDADAIESAARASRCGAEWGAFAVALRRLAGCAVPCRGALRVSGEAWYLRASAQYRWPALQQWLRSRWRRYGTWLPPGLRRRLGLADYGWYGR